MTPAMQRKLTLGQVARTCGLARASLLHYEALGLLMPAGRSPAGYRLYGEAEIERLHAIRRYREAGLSLPAIGALLASRRPREEDPESEPAALLENRLLSLSREVELLREQQKMLALLLATPEFRTRQSCQGKAAWVALLARAGFDEKDMRQWHKSFEADSPEEHAIFLRSLGLVPGEIAAIRQWSTAN
ncbi:MAG: MerR family transcriptional regulator [Betaproteobacteria bacterium HGW-Betaproteobacteria-7]|nr:MAG: MerR family transcriptional regulator [Betaproteobacteria bacterium HGW-Betaproteobacteria-7]